jgi:hypothetical protein
MLTFLIAIVFLITLGLAFLSLSARVIRTGVAAIRCTSSKDEERNPARCKGAPLFPKRPLANQEEPLLLRA